MNPDRFYLEPIGPESNAIIGHFLEQEACVSMSDSKCEEKTGRPIKAWEVELGLLPTLLAGRTTQHVVFIVYREVKQGILRPVQDLTLLTRINLPRAKELAHLIRRTISASAARDKTVRGGRETRRVKAYSKYARSRKRLRTSRKCACLDSTGVGI